MLLNVSKQNDQDVSAYGGVVHTEEGVLQTEEGVSLRGSHGGYIEIWRF